MRNVFGTVRQIQMRWATDSKKSYRDAVLLRPKLAYFAEREKRGEGWWLYRHGNPAKGSRTCLELLNKGDVADEEKQIRFDRFTELFEAIVAYHKKHGGRNTNGENEHEKHQTFRTRDYFRRRSKPKLDSI